MNLSEAKQFLNDKGYELIDEAMAPIKFWVVTFSNENEASEQEYQFCSEGGWDSVVDVTRIGNTLYIEYSKKIENVVDEWFGDKAELISSTELSDVEDEIFAESMNEDINNPDEPATKKQLWALFCLTKQDYRNKGLTKGEASKLISDLNDEKNGKKPVEKNVKEPKPEPEIEGIKVGDIFSYHFGYSMCLNSYVKVKAIRGKKATIVELGKDCVEGSMMQGRVVPDPKAEVKDSTQIALIKPDKYYGGVCLRVPFHAGRYETFHKWDGQPDYEDHFD